MDADDVDAGARLLLLQVTRGEMSRRDAHPHMNNLVYGRRSAPSAVSDPVDHSLVCPVCFSVGHGDRRIPWGFSRGFLRVFVSGKPKQLR